MYFKLVLFELFSQPVILVASTLERHYTVWCPFAMGSNPKLKVSCQFPIASIACSKFRTGLAHFGKVLRTPHQIATRIKESGPGFPIHFNVGVDANYAPERGGG